MLASSWPRLVCRSNPPSTSRPGTVSPVGCSPHLNVSGAQRGACPGSHSPGGASTAEPAGLLCPGLLCHQGASRPLPPSAPANFSCSPDSGLPLTCPRIGSETPRTRTTVTRTLPLLLCDRGTGLTYYTGALCGQPGGLPCIASSHGLVLPSSEPLHSCTAQNKGPPPACSRAVQRPGPPRPSRCAAHSTGRWAAGSSLQPLRPAGNRWSFVGRNWPCRPWEGAKWPLPQSCPGSVTVQPLPRPRGRVHPSILPRSAGSSSSFPPFCPQRKRQKGTRLCPGGRGEPPGRGRWLSAPEHDAVWGGSCSCAHGH